MGFCDLQSGWGVSSFWGLFCATSLETVGFLSSGWALDLVFLGVSSSWIGCRRGILIGMFPDGAIYHLYARACQYPILHYFPAAGEPEKIQ